MVAQNFFQHPKDLCGLVHCDSPGIWTPPDLLGPEDSMTTPGTARQLQSPTILFFMAVERRICKFLVDKSLD